ncbi:MscL family protein [Adhaeribacter radiodurans]|uniref:MscL family protein n=1 Tax=Adhaeribacter radiodurans TaxID=2745197 RepID=UPI001FE5D1B9|nr:MscL family protein [Adhaeribacter radiodurans]
MLKGFKEFTMRGNVIDPAVGVIIRAAFGRMVDSVVNDLVMPLAGKTISNVEFSKLYIANSGKIIPGMALADAKKLQPVFA